MKTVVLTVGKIKEKFFSDAIAEYSKRLTRYCKLEVVEVKDEKTMDNPSENEKNIVLLREAERLLKYIDDDSFVITLEIEGKQLDSVMLSKKMEELFNSGKSKIIFVIGGSFGLHESIVKRSDYHLSFSKMTFPHQLMRVILLEQIYRAFKIMSGEPYHK